MGDGTRHGTKECGHRASHQVQITSYIYLVDLNDGNLDNMAGDETIFPPYEERWERIWAQRGRHWNRNDGSVSLVKEEGRKLLNVSNNVNHLQPNCALLHFGQNERTKSHPL